MNCLTSGDHVIVSDSLTTAAAPFSKARCMVKSIYKWDPKAGEADTEEATKTKSDDAGTPKTES
jgi:hypothetical protein